MSSPSARPIPGNIAEYVALAAITAIGVALRFWAIGAQPIWLDEAFSIWVAGHQLSDLIEFAGHVDHHPPLYYVFLHFWQQAFGDGQGAVRVLSALLASATIPVFYWGGRFLVGRPAALIAALLLVVSPFHVRYGQEARMYALMTFLGAAMLWSLAVYLADSRAGSSRRRVAMIGLAGAQAALMLTHNTAAVLAPMALNIAVIGPYVWSRGRKACALPALNERRFLRGWLAVQFAALVFWLPWLPRFIGQTGTVYQDFWIEPLTGYFVWLTFHNFNLAYPDGWFPGSPWWDILYWGLALTGMFALRKRGSVAFLLAILFLAPALAELAISVRRPILYDRTLIWTTLPYYVLIGSGLRWAAGRFPRSAETERPTDGRRRVRLAAVAGLLLTLVVLSAFSLRSYYRDFEKEDWPAAAAFVAANAKPDDIVLFNAPWGQIPLTYYARLEGVRAVMRGMPVDLFGRGELESRMTDDELPYLQGLVAAHQDVWLVYTHEWYTDRNGLIVEELERTFDLVEERTFSGPRVLHFRRAADAGGGG